MLDKNKYVEEFKVLQEKTVRATNDLKKTIAPGQSEKEIETNYYKILENYGFTKHWYPILIYVGDMTGKPITRKVHLPSSEIVLRENDLIFIDCTPMKKTIWTNWCDTFVIGHNEFFEKLISDTSIIIDKLAEFTSSNANTIGELYNYGLSLLVDQNLQVLDPYKDFGHAIFQIPEGQTVEKTSMENRLLINESFKYEKLNGILSIEPQLGRINPIDKKMYGVKLQKILYLD